jgi:hypothetical protein
MKQPTPLPRSQSGALLDGIRFLARRPGWTVGLVVLGTLLGQLGPALEILAKAGGNPVMLATLNAVSAMPMVFYFVPRWVSWLDCDLLDSPSNPGARWPALFEQRWLRAGGAKVLVQTVGTLGLLAIFPGIVIFTLAGFAPTRILLRGETFGDALRWSARAMARYWRSIVPATLAILLILLALWLAESLAGYSMFIRFGVDGPDAWTQLKHPFIWNLRAFESVILLWVSASFLSLYQRLERLVAEAEAPGQSSPR